MQETLIIILLLVIIALSIVNMLKKDNSKSDNNIGSGDNLLNQELTATMETTKQDLITRLDIIDKEFNKIEARFGDVVEKQINSTNTTKADMTKTLNEAQEKTLRELNNFQEKVLKDLNSSDEKTLKELNDFKERISKDLNGSDEKTLKELNDFQERMIKDLNISDEKTLKELHDFQEKTLKGLGTSQEDMLTRLTGFQNIVLSEIHKNNQNNLKSNNDQREQVISIIGEKLETSTKKFTDLSSALINTINNELKKEIELNGRNKEEIINEVRNSLSKHHTETSTENQKFLERIEKRFNDSQTYVTQTVGELKKEIGSLVEKQDNLTNLESTIKEFNHVLSSPKLRGLFGEQNLEALLTNYYGENENFWQRQYKLESGMMPDAVIICPEPINNIAVDAKFPLDNYRKMMDLDITDHERKEFQKKFATDLKNKIKEVTKYTKSKELANQAILFIPAEAIFIEVCSNYPEIIELGYKENIWIAGPTTLMAILTTIKMSVEKVHLNNNAEKILASLDKLGDDFIRYETRNNDLDKYLEKLVEERRTSKITTNKLINEFTKIKNLK